MKGGGGSNVQRPLRILSLKTTTFRFSLTKRNWQDCKKKTNNSYSIQLSNGRYVHPGMRFMRKKNKASTCKMLFVRIIKQKNSFQLTFSFKPRPKISYRFFSHTFLMWGRHRLRGDGEKHLLVFCCCMSDEMESKTRSGILK